MRRVLLAGAAHFALVFAAGFALGTLRVLVLAPSLGERTAELAEQTFVLTLSGLSLAESFASRDPLSGTAYWIALALFAAAPALLDPTAHGVD